MRILRAKQVTLAAALTGKNLTVRFASTQPCAFSYILNAGPAAVREMALEIPREILHERGGVNRKSAMHMAHGVIGLCDTQAGFALIMEPDVSRAYMALSAAGRIAWQALDLSEDMSEQEKIGFALRNAIRFCTACLEDYPADMPDSASADH